MLNTPSSSAVENENVVDENVDPNVPEPLDCLETGHVSMTSDDDWVPDEDAIGHMSTEDEIDDSQDEEEEEEANLLPQEHRQRRVNRRCAVALVDAVNVEYLDHGSRSKRCEVCHAPLYEWEVKKRKNEPTTGGSLCCHDGKAAFLSDHFDRPPPEPLRSLWDDLTSREGKLFHSNIRYFNSALQMASSTSNVVHKSGVSMMVAQGSIYHLLNPIETSRDPQYVQLYIYCATNDLGLLAVSQLEVM